MAILTPAQLVEIRRGTNDKTEPVSWDKATINAAAQAIEDWYESERATVGALIDTATSPTVFTNAQKKRIGKYWMRQKWGLE